MSPAGRVVRAEVSEVDDIGWSMSAVPIKSSLASIVAERPLRPKPEMKDAAKWGGQKESPGF